MNNKSYIILQYLTIPELQERVISKLHDGYACLGGATMIKNKDGFSYISQTIILKSLL